MKLSGSRLALVSRLLLFLGGIWLLFAGSGLVFQALDLGFSPWHAWWLVPASMIAGLAKERLLMHRRLRDNIRRMLESEASFWPWQVYPLQLWIFIALMVLVVALLKTAAADSALLSAALAALDLAVGTALLSAGRRLGTGR